MQVAELQGRALSYPDAPVWPPHSHTVQNFSAEAHTVKFTLTQPHNSEVHTHQVNGLDVVLLDCLHVCGVAADRQDAAMHARVQRLHTACGAKQQQTHMQHANVAVPALQQPCCPCFATALLSLLCNSITPWLLHVGKTCGMLQQQGFFSG
jgi:hypothetical protein